MVGNRTCGPARPTRMMSHMPSPSRLAGVGLATAAVLLGSGVALAAGASHGAPVIKAAPHAAPSTSDAKGSCTTPDAESQPVATKGRLMWVDPHATKLVAVWLPGLNANPCVARRTVSGPGAASRIATAIDHAAAFPQETLFCPYSDNASVRLYFLDHAGRYEYADLALGGCGPISAPGRASRWNNDHVRSALRPVAPPAWRHYVGGATPGHGTPVNQTAPDTAPTSSVVNGTCTTSGVSTPPPSTSTEPLMWVDPNPTSVTAIWLPGLNSTDCHAQRTVSDATLAGQVATAIEHAKAFPTGALPCPFDDNTSVRLYFGYSSGSDGYADVSLSGCRPVSAPDRASRWGDTQIDTALSPAAPPAWQSYLGVNSSTAHVHSASHHGAPVYRTAPGGAPVMTRHDGACTVQSAGGSPNAEAGKGLVWVSPHPTGVITLWIPGENAKRCVARRTVDGASSAARLATAIDGAKAFPRGVFCPRDDGSAARLYFTYANGRDQYVNVELTGCHTVDAPGRSSRETTAAISQALSQTAPPAWQQEYFS